MFSSGNIQLDSDNSSQEIDTDLLTLDELGAFMCQKISWYNHRCQYFLRKNKHGANDILLIIDDTIYTHTRFVPYLQNSTEITCRLCEPVKIDITSIFCREIDGKGISYLPLKIICYITHNFFFNKKRTFN